MGFYSASCAISAVAELLVNIMCACVRVCVQLRVASAGVMSQVRWLNLHEYHSKKMMKDGNITVQRFRMAESVDDAVEIAKTFSK